MNPRTTATLDQLEKAVWFSRVGVRDTTSAIVLTSWDEAISHCSSIEWENLQLEAMNQFRERIAERAPNKLNNWNEVVRGVKPVIIPLVSSKIQEVVEKYGLSKEFSHAVEWDILGVCMEAEYAGIYPPGFYASQGYWYISGHFPCGWHGQFPSGVPIIF